MRRELEIKLTEAETRQALIEYCENHNLVREEFKAIDVYVCSGLLKFNDDEYTMMQEQDDLWERENAIGTI